MKCEYFATLNLWLLDAEFLCEWFCENLKARIPVIFQAPGNCILSLRWIIITLFFISIKPKMKISRKNSFVARFLLSFFVIVLVDFS